jgi:predicted kinase
LRQANNKHHFGQPEWFFLDIAEQNLYNVQNNQMKDNMENQSTQPVVVIMVGLPASGKSTARALAVKSGASANSYQYSTDDIVDRWAAEQNLNYDDVWSANIKAATALADAEVKLAIQNKQGVLWDQTNMSAKKRLNIVKKFGVEYRKECICMLPPFEPQQQLELERRLADRPGKNIPKFIMKNMLTSFVLPDVAEGFDRVMFFDIYGNMVDQTQAVELFGGET